jgi:CBASS immunity sensor of nucleotide second messenger signals/HNH endonuclease
MKKSPSKHRTASPVVVARNIPWLSQLILFVKAGGICEFDGCNKFLLEHHVTLTEGNFAQMAHIVAFQPDGPRGNGSHRPENINEISNLMLLCPECHKLVDDHTTKFTVRTLREYKERHERHIHYVTGLSPELKTHLLVFTANIGDQVVYIPFGQMLEAVSPRYPMSRNGTTIDLTQLHVDSTASLSAARETMEHKIRHLYETGGEAEAIKHVSVFALGPIPLLMYLGTLLSNKIATDFFQRHRDAENWTWKESSEDVKYQFKTVRSGTDLQNVAVMLSLSGTITTRDLPEGIDDSYYIYELTLDGKSPDPTFLRTKRDLEGFRVAYQSGLSAIMQKHGMLKSLHVFPAVPAPIAILCGRELLPKVHPELLVYDFDKSKVGFNFQLKVNNHGN